jgi:CRISPR-associated endonuclease Csn1
MSASYKLGLDLGTTSIGWCAIKLEDNKPHSIIDCGVRIYDDGRDNKSKEPLSVARRDARGIRRNKSRYKSRRNKLLDILTDSGLSLDKTTELFKPYELRYHALERRLTDKELGRVLFHLNQRRGFKSNRKTDGGDEKESTKIAKATEQTKEKMSQQECRTYGEFLYERLQNKLPVRINQNVIAEYDIYPLRSLYEDEFEQIWSFQARHNPKLTNELKQKIYDTIFYQRPLAKQQVGLCQFEFHNGKERLEKASLLFQKFKVLCVVNNLKVNTTNGHSIPLSEQQRGKVYQELVTHAHKLPKNGILSFSKIRKLINAPSDSKFNYEKDNQKGLEGDVVSRKLADKSRFGESWLDLTDQEKTEITKLIKGDHNDENIRKKLKNAHSHLEDRNIDAILKSHLPLGYGSLSACAIKKILPFLQQGMLYSDACRRAGYQHSNNNQDDKLLDELPYYGQALPNRVIPSPKSKDINEREYGKINNPTVHIILNQLRCLINDLIVEYGRPDKIVVELARDLKLNQEQKKKAIKQQLQNKKNNEEAEEELEKHNQDKKNRDNRIRYRLWKEQEEICILSGERICSFDLFNGKYEIDHIIPFSRCFDDSTANKILIRREENRRKSNKIPYEAFSNDPQKWQQIQNRVQDSLPANKKWRFAEDVLSKLKGQEEDIIARQLTDTQYLSRVAKEYLTKVCPAKNVSAIPGKLTSILRRNWGINLPHLLGDKENKKLRDDHRHHAIDAFVIACTDRSLLQKMARINSKYEEGVVYKIKTPLPYENYRNDLRKFIEKVVISHKPDHGGAKKAITKGETTGQLHEDTYYGYHIKDPVDKKKTLYKVRKEVSSLGEKDIKNVVDDGLKKQLVAHYQKHSTLKNFKQANRAKILVSKSTDVMIPLKDKTGKPYKYVQGGNNYCTEIYCILEGTNKGKWKSETIKAFDIHQKSFISKWRRKGEPRAKLVMRLHNNDMVAYDEDGERKICKVKKMYNGFICLRSHLISKEEGDKLSWVASAPQLQKRNARKISVNMLGKVTDCGGYHKFMHIK